jgi:hypothetical protein
MIEEKYSKEKKIILLPKLPAKRLMRGVVAERRRISERGGIRPPSPPASASQGDPARHPTESFRLRSAVCNVIRYKLLSGPRAHQPEAHD